MINSENCRKSIVMNVMNNTCFAFQVASREIRIRATWIRINSRIIVVYPELELDFIVFVFPLECDKGETISAVRDHFRELSLLSFGIAAHESEAELISLGLSLEFTN
jgi:hypothetical protein